MKAKWNQTLPFASDIIYILSIYLRLTGAYRGAVFSGEPPAWLPGRVERHRDSVSSRFGVMFVGLD